MDQASGEIIRCEDRSAEDILADPLGIIDSDAY